MIGKKEEKINIVSIFMSNVNLWMLILKKVQIFLSYVSCVKPWQEKVKERVTGLDPAV